MYDINADAIGQILSDEKVNDVVVTLIKDRFLKFLKEDDEFRSIFGNLLIGGDYGDSDSDSDSNDSILSRWGGRIGYMEDKIAVMRDSITAMTDSLYNADYPLTISNTPKKNQIYYRTSDRNIINLDKKTYNIKSNNYSKGVFNYGIITFNDDITEIPASLFKYVETDEIYKENIRLTEIKCNSAITSIGASAFEDCANLTKIEDISNVTKFGISCFKGTQIKTVRIHSGFGFNEGEFSFTGSGLEMIATTVDKAVFDNGGNVINPFKDFTNKFINSGVQLKVFVPDDFVDKFVIDDKVPCVVSPISEATIDDIGGATGIWSLTNKSINSVGDDLKSFKLETGVVLQGLQTSAFDQFGGLQARLDKFDGVQQGASARLDDVVAKLDGVQQGAFNQIDSVFAKLDGYQQDIDKRLKLEQEKVKFLQDNYQGVQSVRDMVLEHNGALTNIDSRLNAQIYGLQTDLWNKTEEKIKDNNNELSSKFVTNDNFDVKLSKAQKEIMADFGTSFASVSEFSRLTEFTNTLTNFIGLQATNTFNDAVSYTNRSVAGIQSEYMTWQTNAEATYATKDDIVGVQTKIAGVQSHAISLSNGVQAQLKKDLTTEINGVTSRLAVLDNINEALSDTDDDNLSDGAKSVRTQLFAKVNSGTLQSFNNVQSNLTQLSAQVSGVQNNMNGYVKTSTLNDYALKSDLNSFYTKSDLNSRLGELLKITDFESTLSDYVLKDNLQTTLSDYAVKNDFDKFSTKLTTEFDGKLSGYVLKDNLQTTLSDYATKDDLSDELTNVNNKITSFNGQLSNYVLDSKLTTTLSDYARKTDLSDKVADFNGQLSNYVLKENLNTTLTQYATKETLGDYVKTSTMDNYPTKDKLSLTLSDYAKTTTLSDYARKTDLDNYAKNSSLSSYVTTESLGLTLSGYVKGGDLTPYAKTSEVDSKLQSYYTSREINDTLGGYITTSALTTRLGGYVARTELNSTLTDFVQTSVLSDYVRFVDVNKTLEESYTTRDMLTEVLDLIDAELSKVSSQVSGYTFSQSSGLRYQWNRTYEFNANGNTWSKPIVYVGADFATTNP